MNRCLRGSLPKICIYREPPELSVHAFSLTKRVPMDFFSGFGCLFSVFSRFRLTSCQSGTDKIKGIKIKEAIKCRISHILIPISFLGNSFFQIMSLYIIRCNLPYLSFISDPWQRVLHEPLPPARREAQDYP